MNEFGFDRIPLWGVFALTFAATLVAIKIGLWLGSARQRSSPDETHGPVSEVVGATAALLAFMLAFTFGIAASRYAEREALLLDEVNAIETAYLRADLLQEPHRDQTRALLRQYVDLRAVAAKDRSQLAQALARSPEIHERLWSHAVAMAQKDRSSEIDALFISALNEVFDLHTKRATVSLQYRIPEVIWIVLLFTTVLTMGGLGYEFGLAKVRRIGVTFILTLTFSSVMLLIADLDRATEGALTVDKQPLLDLQQQMRTGPR